MSMPQRAQTTAVAPSEKASVKYDSNRSIVSSMRAILSKVSPGSMAVQELYKPGALNIASLPCSILREQSN